MDARLEKEIGTQLINDRSMNLIDVLEVTATLILAVGGGGAVVIGMSGYLGKIWANRLMATEKAKHDADLERLRAELTAKNASELEGIRASVDLVKSKLLGAHTDKVVLYRMVTDIVAEMMADIVSALGTGRPMDPERLFRFERERYRAYGYLGVFAPQHVMNAFDAVIDNLLGVIEGSSAPSFQRARDLGIAMINEIRIDLDIDRSPIAYLGSRQ